MGSQREHLYTWSLSEAPDEGGWCIMSAFLVSEHAPSLGRHPPHCPSLWFRSFLLGASSLWVACISPHLCLWRRQRGSFPPGSGQARSQTSITQIMVSLGWWAAGLLAAPSCESKQMQSAPERGAECSGQDTQVGRAGSTNHGNAWELLRLNPLSVGR